MFLTIFVLVLLATELLARRMFLYYLLDFANMLNLVRSFKSRGTTDIVSSICYKINVIGTTAHAEKIGLALWYFVFAVGTKTCLWFVTTHISRLL